MKTCRRSFYLTLVSIFAIGILSTCTNNAPVGPVITVKSSDNLQLTAIKDTRVALGLPNLTLESKGMDTMINSPSRDLSVVIYVDSEGRKYSVEPRTNTVVEIDARDLLTSIPANVPSISQDTLKTKALGIARATTPNFDSLLPGLIDDSGSKGDLYFFDWRKPASQNEIMSPFIQIGFDKSGLIFAYINTLSLK